MAEGNVGLDRVKSLLQYYGSDVVGISYRGCPLHNELFPLLAESKSLWPQESKFFHVIYHQLGAGR